MNSSIFRFTLDLHSLHSQVTIPAFLGDTGKTLYITFTDGGKPFHLDKGSLAKITIKRPTGSTLEDFCMIKDNAVVVYPFSQNEATCAVEGINDCDITLYDAEGYKIGSPWFSILVAEQVKRSEDFGISDEDYKFIEAVAVAEAGRQLAETGRVEAEAARVEAENARSAAEQGRADADAVRAELLTDINARLSTLEDGHTIDHRKLTDRDAEDSHPISAITGLAQALEQFGSVDGTVGERLAKVESDVADLLYKPIAITSFSSSVGTVEMGSKVDDVTLTWALSKEAKGLTLDGEALEVAERQKVLTGLGLTSNKTWTLKAVDERDAEAAKTASVTFANGIYYGAAVEPDAYDSAFILGLTKTLRNSKLTSITAVADGEKYIYYCLPVRLGTCVFSYGANEGGVSLVDTVAFTNASGYEEQYYIYRSDESGLGNTTLGVK